jgi:tetratricopeptide (TPR) repeat protein
MGVALALAALGVPAFGRALSWTGPAAAPARGEQPPAGPNRPARLVLDDPPQWFVPRQPPTEADDDRREALALFAAARLRELRQDDAGALRLYQRALRSDPRAEAIVRPIVTLAFRLGRSAEAIRYALKLAEVGNPDTILLQRLGRHLSEMGDWAGALAMYERVLGARRQAEPAPEDVILWMEMGRLYYLVEKPDKSAERLAPVMDAIDHPERFGPDHSFKDAILADAGTAYALMGEVFFLTGQYDRAAEAFQRAHRAMPNKGLLGYNLARIEARRGKHAQALENLQAYFHQRLTAQGLAPYRLLAEILKALKKEGELLGRVEKLRADDPANLPLAYFLAEKYFEAGQTDKAETLYRDLLSKTPTTVGFRHLAAIYRTAKRYDDLLKLMGIAVASTGSLQPLAEENRPLASDADVVRALIEAARARVKAGAHGLTYEAQVGVALLALEGKQFDAAGEFFELACKTQPAQADKLWLTWGLELVLAEQHARAVEVLQRGIERKIAPDNPAFPFYLAGALEMLGRTEEALAAARKAVELAASRPKPAMPKKPPAAKSAPQEDAAAKRAAQDLSQCLTRVPWILYHAKRYEEAEKACLDLMKKHEGDYGSAEIRELVREVRLMLSNVAVNRGQTASAVEWLEQVLDEFPDDASALNDLGYLWAEQGKHLARAHRMIAGALRQDPDNAAYRDSLGWVLFQLGRVPEAVAELEKAAAKEPDPTVLDHLGDARRAAGRLDQAREAWRRAAAGYRKSGETEKAGKAEQKVAAPP